MMSVSSLQTDPPFSSSGIQIKLAEYSAKAKEEKKRICAMFILSIFLVWR